MAVFPSPSGLGKTKTVMLRGHVEDTCSLLDYNHYGHVASNAGALAPLCCCIYPGVVSLGYRNRRDFLEPQPGAVVESAPGRTGGNFWYRL